MEPKKKGPRDVEPKRKGPRECGAHEDRSTRCGTREEGPPDVNPEVYEDVIDQ